MEGIQTKDGRMRIALEIEQIWRENKQKMKDEDQKMGFRNIQNNISSSIKVGTWN